MSYAKGPESCAPDDQRCEALVQGKKGWPDWAQKDHRCTRRAQASRAGHVVCWTHNKKAEVEFWCGAPDDFIRFNRYGKSRGTT